MDLKQLLQRLKGRKTYLAAAGLALAAVCQLLAGDAGAAYALACEALAAAGLRSALAGKGE